MEVTWQVSEGEGARGSKGGSGSRVDSSNLWAKSLVDTFDEARARYKMHQFLGLDGEIFFFFFLVKPGWTNSCGCDLCNLLFRNF